MPSKHVAMETVNLSIFVVHICFMANVLDLLKCFSIVSAQDTMMPEVNAHDSMLQASS